MSFKLQSFKFAIVGTVTAIIYYAVLFSLVEYLGLSIIVSSSLAYLFAIAFNYVMHYQWTFRAENPHKVAIFRFIIMNIVGFLINLSIMSYGASIAPEYYLLIQTFAIGVIVIWNFIMSSLWVYKNNHQKKLISSETNVE